MIFQTQTPSSGHGPRGHPAGASPAVGAAGPILPLGQLAVCCAFVLRPRAEKAKYRWEGGMFSTQACAGPTWALASFSCQVAVLPGPRQLSCPPCPPNTQTPLEWTSRSTRIILQLPSNRSVYLTTGSSLVVKDERAPSVTRLDYPAGRADATFTANKVKSQPN